MAAGSVDECAIGKNDMVGEFDSDIEEGVGVFLNCQLYRFVWLKFSHKANTFNTMTSDACLPRFPM